MRRSVILSDYSMTEREHEPCLRRLIFGLTSFASIDDHSCEHRLAFGLRLSSVTPLRSVMLQLLSNMMSPTGDPDDQGEIASRQLATYAGGIREDDIIV